MSFNSGFSTQGVPFVTGSDGQVLTWSSAEDSWVAGNGLSSVDTAIITSGNVTGSGSPSNPVRLKDDIIISGDITVQGTASITHLDTLYQQSLVVGDKYITILSGSSTHAQMNGSGILWGSGSSDGSTGDQGSVAYLLYRSGSDSLEVFPSLKTSGYITASSGISGSFYGDGSGITNLQTSVDNVLYVSVSGSDTSGVGSLTEPFKTIQKAINHASSSYSNFSQPVIIEVGPGKYVENLSISRHNTYIRSHLNKTDQRAIEINGSVAIDCPTATQKYNHVIGFEGILFNNSNSNPTVLIAGTGQFLVYFKNSYIASANASSNLIRLTNTRTFDNTKLTIRHTTFNAQKAGADALKIEGGDIKLDSVEFFCSSNTPGLLNAISASGNTNIAADRLLIEMSGPITGSAIINGSTRNSTDPLLYGYPTIYLTNSTINQYNTGGAAANAATINTSRNIFLWNVIALGSYKKVYGTGVLAALTYGNITSDNTDFVIDPTVTKVYLREIHGSITASTITASSGLQTSAINGIIPSNIAVKNLTNTFTAQNTFYEDIVFTPLLVGDPTPPEFFLRSAKFTAESNSKIVIKGGSRLESTGSVYVTDGNVQVQNGYFSGSGVGLSNITSSNWDTTNGGFVYDVRNQINGSGNITYNKTSGVVSTVSNPSFTSVTASNGFNGNLYGTSTNSDKLGNLPAANYALTGSSNIFKASQTITGSLSISSFVSASSVTSSFSGDGSNLTNLTGSNWSPNGLSTTGSFYKDVVSAFSASEGVNIIPLPDGRYQIKANVAEAGLNSDGINILGNGAVDNKFRLNTEISTSVISASQFSAENGFTGSLSGTSSYATNSDKLDGYHASSFALTGSSNSFTANNQFTTITASVGVSARLYGTASHALSAENLSGSRWTGGVPSFYDDVQSAFIEGDGINLVPQGDKIKIISLASLTGLNSSIIYWKFYR